MFFTNRALSAGLAIATLFMFAAQPWSYMSHANGDGMFLVALTVLAAISTALVAAQAFHPRALLAAAVAAVATGLFLWGNCYADAALDNTIGPRLDWWSEKVAVTTMLLGAPGALASGLLAAVFSRLIARRARP